MFDGCGSVEVSIRVAQAAELEMIIGLQTLAVVGVPAGCRKYNARQVDALVKGQARARRMYWNFETVLVAENNDLTSLTASLPNCSPTGRRVVGFICLSRFDAHIQGIFVHPDFMGLGIGSRLMMAIEDLASQRRCRQMMVMSSMESIKFYERHGYVSFANTGFYATRGGWIPCQMLKKDLNRFTKADATESSYGNLVDFVWTILFMALAVVVLKQFLK